jgi:DNA (cytosine-5)-methyltransferase 1
MVDNQTNIFEMLYPTFKMDKPIRTIELFGGYGSQLLSLKYLNVDVEQWKLCEWAIKSIQAYKDIHFEDDNFDYSGELSLEKVKKYLLEKGISSNYNEPMTQQQINRLNEKQARTIYNNIKATHNLVNIQQVKGKDLEIIDKDKYTYIMTYSFPCQDLSLAGKGKGMSDTSTRSGMLWEVERILTECKEKPQILLMENVPQVHGQDNIADFNKWQYSLEAMGYKNYWKDLIATDYGIPQTRNRCFMISILGDYNYTFPKPIPLKLKLKDMLEDNVDEKYFLSDKQIESLESGVYNASKPSEKLKITDKGLCQTLDTMSGGNRQPLVRVGNKSLQETLKQNEIKDTCYIDTYNKRIDEEKIGTITTGVSFRNNTFLAIKNATKQGYLEATEGDGIDISSRMEHHRETVQKQKSQTITTVGGKNVGVVVKGGED